MQRPENFKINYASSLARGLVFAGLAGDCVGSKQYIDSSPYRNHGVLTNMVPGEDWTWVPELGRWGLDFAAASSQAVFGDIGTLPATFSLSVWSYGTVTTGTQQFSAYDGTLRVGIETSTHLYGIRSNASYARWDSVIVNGQWVHWCIVWNGSSWNAYRDAAPLGSPTLTGDPSDVDAVGYAIGCRRKIASDRYWDGSISDTTIHSRALSLPEIQTLADPADPMLSGLILPPKRKYYVIKYHPTTARLLMLKQNNRFLSLQKI